MRNRFSLGLFAGVTAVLLGISFVNGNVPGTDSSTRSEYRFQPGDDVQIQVMDVPDLSITVKVRPDGMVSLMLLDDVHVAGRTVAEVRNELTNSYSKHYRNPRVGVFARTFTNRTVYVTGEVAHAGAVPLSTGMTAMQAVIEAGGLMPNSRIQESVLLRQVEGGPRKVIPLNLHEVLQGTGTDTILQPSDVVYIPKSDIKVFVGGEVAKPGLLPMEKDMTVMAAVMQAGGFLDTAGRSRAVVLRNKGNGTPSLVEVRLDEVMRGTTADTVLQPFDVVFVPKSKIAKLDQAMDQYIRKVVPLTMTGGFSYVVGGIGNAGTNCFF